MALPNPPGHNGTNVLIEQHGLSSKQMFRDQVIQGRYRVEEGPVMLSW